MLALFLNPSRSTPPTRGKKGALPFFALLTLLAADLPGGEDPPFTTVLAVATARSDSFSPAEAAAPASENLSTLAPLRAVAENPYVARLVAGARAELDRPDPAEAWPALTLENAPGFFALRGTNDPRDARQVAARMDAFLWLHSHPASPLRGDPELLARFLRRAHTYADALTLLAANTKLGGRDLLDDFALGPALTALREFAALHPEHLSPAQRARWDEAFRATAANLATRIDNHRQAHAKGYTNIDLTLALHALNLGLHLRDDTWLERHRALLHLQRDHVLPDGATRYIWSQNESIGYHDVVAHYLGRIHEISADPVAADILRALEWYGPVSVGRLGEFWTAPSWKHQWNGATRPAGGEPVVALTRNPYVRGMVVPPSPSDAPGRDWPSARWQVSWWSPDIPSRPLPDNFTVLDRNIAGPRAWYSRFNYAATLRAIPLDEPGHATLLGAQVLRPDFSRGVLLMGVYPRVQLGSDRARPQSFAWLTSDLQSTSALGRTWSAFAADYQLHAFGSSRKGRLVPWRARQLWLGLPDRLVGVIDLTPDSTSTPAATVEGLVRFGTGGTVFGPPQKLVATTPGRHAFGDFIVIIHASDFAESVIETSPFRLPAAPFADLILRDPAPISGPRRFVVEIRPAYVTADAVVRAASGTAGLRVIVGPKTFTVRPDAPRDPAAPHRLPVEVSSPDPADHAPAWPDIQALLAAPPPAPSGP